MSSINGFATYYFSDRAHLFELQSLLRLRCVAGDRELATRVLSHVRRNVLGRSFERDALRESLLEMRNRLEAEAEGRDVKRGPGGLVDIEFIAQFLQLAHAEDLSIRSPNTARALELLGRADHLRAETAETLSGAYRYLRRLEARLQIVYGLDQEALPGDPGELEKLARRMAHGHPLTETESLVEDFDRTVTRTREIFEEILGTFRSARSAR